MTLSTHQEPSVSFEYRFARDRTAHGEGLSDRMALVRMFARQLITAQPDPPIESIHLYQVERVGDSGSQVFYVDVQRSTLGYVQSFVAKFQCLQDTKREAKGAGRARLAGMCAPFYSYELEAKENVDESGDDKLSNYIKRGLGLIVYEFANVKKPREFREMFLDIDTTDASCVEALRKLYSRIPNLERNEDASKSLADGFKRYYRPGVKPESRIEALASSSHSGLQSLAFSILEAHKFIKESKLHISVPGIAVHGDLHARNLLVSRHDEWDFELIDFDWAHYGHPAKDFVILEATLKYMLLSELIRKKRSPDGTAVPYLPTKAIEILVTCWYTPNLELPSDSCIRDKLADVHLESEHWDAIDRVNSCLRVLRQHARTCMNAYTELPNWKPTLPGIEQYYICLFIITLGLVGYSQTELTWAVIGLAHLGQQLKEAQ